MRIGLLVALVIMQVPCGLSKWIPRESTVLFIGTALHAPMLLAKITLHVDVHVVCMCMLGIPWKLCSGANFLADCSEHCLLPGFECDYQPLDAKNLMQSITARRA